MRSQSECASAFVFEPISVGILLNGTKFGVIRDRGQGCVEAIAFGCKRNPLGFFTTTPAAIVAIFTASKGT